MPDRRSVHQKRRSEDRDDEVTDTPQEGEEGEPARVERARDTSAVAGELLEEIDRALLVGLGYDESEKVDDDQREVREKMFVSGFVQKGGE